MQAPEARTKALATLAGSINKRIKRFIFYP